MEGATVLPRLHKTKIKQSKKKEKHLIKKATERGNDVKRSNGKKISRSLQMKKKKEQRQCKDMCISL